MFIWLTVFGIYRCYILQY